MVFRQELGTQAPWEGMREGLFISRQTSESTSKNDSSRDQTKYAKFFTWIVLDSYLFSEVGAAVPIL